MTEPTGKDLSGASDADGASLFETFRVLEPALRRFVQARVSNDADVDDILQDVAARILGRDQPTQVDNKTAFLFSVASNLMRDRQRRRRARRDDGRVALDEVEIADPAALQDQVVDDRRRLGRLQAALNALPRKEREVFVLHRVEGQTLAQVAEETGLSLAQVRKLVERALARLARKVWKD